MNKISFSLIAVALAMWHGASSADDSLASKFGRNRVKIQHAATPENVSDAKMAAVHSRYDARIKNCDGQASSNKQYCVQEAEEELRVAERRLRDTARDDKTPK